MAMAEPRIEEYQVEKAEWLDRLAVLVSLIKGWAETSGWQTRQVPKPVAEPGLGRYDVPLLLMKRGEVEVVLSPLARTNPGDGGVVDLSLMPGYDDVVSLECEGGRWFIRDAFPPDPTAPAPKIHSRRLPLEEATIRRVLDSASAHA